MDTTHVSDLAAVDYNAGPSILLFADEPRSRERIAAAVVAAGGRLSVACPLDDAVRRIEQHAAPAGVVVELGSGREGVAEDILDAIEQGAQCQRFRSVAIIDRDLIDLAAARTMHADVALLCGDEGGDLAAALEMLVAPRGMRLNDVSTDGAPHRLRELSEEVGRIARTLAALSNQPQQDQPLFKGNGAENDDDADLIVDAPTLRAIIRARRLRDQFFTSEIFADPAWDMRSKV